MPQPEPGVYSNRFRVLVRLVVVSVPLTRRLRLKVVPCVSSSMSCMIELLRFQVVSKVISGVSSSMSCTIQLLRLQVV